MDNLAVEQMLAQLRAQRDTVPYGALRNAYNDACDRLQVLSGKIASPPEKRDGNWGDSEELMQALHDPENQPSQWGTVPVSMSEASRRERIATAALQGLIASVEEGKWEEFAVAAVNCADALIAQLDKNTQTNEQAACDKVLAAVRAYLPPDGISRLEFISRVFEAVDNPKFNAGLKTAEPAEYYDETMMKLHAGWRQRLDRKGEEG